MMKILKSPRSLSALAAGVIFVGVLSIQFSTPSLFDNLDSFILFAQEEVKLEKEVQISSGDIGSNKKIDIEKDVIVNGNLFADKATLDKNTQINGNVSFNELKTHKDTQILGTQTTSISLPVASIPEIPDFQPGTQDFKFKGQDNTLPTGNYQNITLEKDSRLVLTGGIYNISKLTLKENSILIYSALTVLNIQQELKSQQNVSILSGQNLKPDDLVINYQGKKDKKDKNDKGNKPVELGKNSFLNFRLLAPNADVHIREATILRGQIVAKKITIGKGTVVSREESFEKESDLTKIVEEEGGRFIINEIVILFKLGATVSDLLVIADFVNGQATGFLPGLEMGKIEVPTETLEELSNLIDSIKNSNNPLVDDVLLNALLF